MCYQMLYVCECPDLVKLFAWLGVRQSHLKMCSIQSDASKALSCTIRPTHHGFQTQTTQDIANYMTGAIKFVWTSQSYTCRLWRLSPQLLLSIIQSLYHSVAVVNGNCTSASLPPTALFVSMPELAEPFLLVKLLSALSAPDSLPPGVWLNKQGDRLTLLPADRK